MEQAFILRIAKTSSFRKRLNRREKYETKINDLLKRGLYDLRFYKSENSP